MSTATTKVTQNQDLTVGGTLTAVDAVFAGDVEIEGTLTVDPALQFPDGSVGLAQLDDEVTAAALGGLTAASIETKTVTIAADAASGASAADPDWIGATRLGFYPEADNNQPIKSVVIGADGAVTVTLAAASTAEATIAVTALLAAE